MFTRRDDIFTQEKRIDVFSSHQPGGIDERADGPQHDAQGRRCAYGRALGDVSGGVAAHRARYLGETVSGHADRILEQLAPGRGAADLCKAFALPLSAECLKDVTGLTNMRFADMDAWSQAMIDGIANYTGNKEIEARCHAATAGIDAAIDDMIPVVTKHPNTSILSVLLAAGQPMDSIRANIKLAISGGQNEPRDAIAGTIWALLTHPEQFALVQRRQGKVARRVRGICALDRTDRDVAAPGRETLVLWRRRFRTGGSRVLHVRFGQSRRGLLRRP